jgi:hypothetical protein
VAEVSFPVAGGAGVTDANYEKLLGPLVGAGRVAFNPTSSQLSTPLIFADNSGRQVKAYANQAAVIRGFRWESGTTPPVLALDANSSGNPRLDLIVLRLDRSNFTVRLGKTNGTPAAVPAAPAAIQDAGTTGVWELPLATVKVTSSGTTGQPFIQSTDVAPLDWWLAPPAAVTKTGQNPAPTHGMLLHHYDTGRTYRAVGAAWQLMGENGPFTKLTAAGGWTADNLYAQRQNGWTFFQGLITLNVSDRPAGTDLAVCVLPATFRPLHDFYFPLIMSPAQAGWGFIDAQTGQVSVINYGQVFPTGGRLIMGPVTYVNQ